MLVEDIRWERYPRTAAHEAARRFIESLAKRGKSDKTLDAYARSLDDLLASRPEATPEQIAESDDEDIEDYLAHLRTRQPATGRSNVRHLNRSGLSDNTIQLRIVVARLFFDFCILRHWRRNPINPVPRGRLGGDGGQRGLVPRRKRLPWLPPDPAWHAILADLFERETARNRAMILLMYDGALRRQEVIGLRLDDIDWAAGLITIRAEHSKSGYERVVPISASTERLLRHYVQTDRAALLEGFGGLVAGPVFLSESQRNPGAPLSIGTVNDVVARLRGRVGLPLLHPHTFRHLRCTVLRRAGVDLGDIALFAGHRQVETTKLYAQLAPIELGQRVAAATAAFDRRMAVLIAEHTDGA